MAVIDTVHDIDDLVYVITDCGIKKGIVEKIVVVEEYNNTSTAVINEFFFKILFEGDIDTTTVDDINTIYTNSADALTAYGSSI